MNQDKEHLMMISKNEIVHILSMMEKDNPFGKGQRTFNVKVKINKITYDDGEEETYITINHPNSIERMCK